MESDPPHHLHTKLDMAEKATAINSLRFSGIDTLMVFK